MPGIHCIKLLGMSRSSNSQSLEKGNAVSLHTMLQRNKTNWPIKKNHPNGPYIFIRCWPKPLEKVKWQFQMLRTLVGKNVFLFFFQRMEMFHGAFLNPLLAWLENWLNTLTHICIYMVFTNNNRKHFCSSQSALPSVDNSMLIITQHITESKLTVMQTQLQFKETKEICREAKCLHKNTFAYLNNGM